MSAQAAREIIPYPSHSVKENLKKVSTFLRCGQKWPFQRVGMALQQPHPGGAQRKAQCKAAHHVPHMMHPGEHPQAADEQGNAHHHAARSGVEIQPHRRQHGGAQRVAGGHGVSTALLCYQRGKAGLLVGAGEVQPTAQQRAAPEHQPRYKDGAGDEHHKVQRGLLLGEEQPREPDVQQAQQHRIAHKGHQRQPPVQKNDQPLYGRMGAEPVIDGLILFCGQSSSPPVGTDIRNRCPDSFPHQRAPEWNPCADTAGGAGVPFCCACQR